MALSDFVIGADTSGLRSAIADVLRAETAVDKMARRIDVVNGKTVMRGADGRFKSASAAAAEYSAELTTLTQRYNPLMAASIAYEKELRDIAAAQRAGIITTQAQADAARNAAAAMHLGAGSAGQLGTEMRQTGSHTANVFAQLNDIGVMMAAGQNPIQLAMQQGTQLNQVWTSMGAQGRTIGGVFGVLKGAIASMISPMSLLTLGAIAGTAALVGWVSSLLTAESEVKSLDDTMSDLASSVDKYVKSNSDIKRSILELATEYGALASVAREAIDNMTEADRIEAAIALSAALAANIEAVTSYTLTGFNAGLNSSISGFSKLSIEFINITSAMNELTNSSTELDRVFASQNLSKEMLAAYGSVEAMPKEMRTLYNNLQEVITAGSSLIAQTNGWASAMSDVAAELRVIMSTLGQIGGGALERAAVAAGRQALAAGKTATEAQRAVQYAREDQDLLKNRIRLESELGAVKGGIAAAALELDARITRNQSERWEAELEAARLAERESKKKDGSGGGAARELAAAQKGFQSLRELMEQDTLFEFAEYEKRQSQLDEALAQQLLTRQQYDEISTGLRTLYFGSEYEQQQLQYMMEQDALTQALEQQLITKEEYAAKMAQVQIKANDSELGSMASFYGSMASIVALGGSKMAKAAATFGAVEATVNAYRAAAQAIADPTVPFWGKAAAYASVLATGLKSVAAIKSAGGGGGGAAAGSASSSAAVTTAPAIQRVTLDLVGGSEYERAWAESLVTQLYEKTKDGARVTVNRT